MGSCFPAGDHFFRSSERMRCHSSLSSKFPVRWRMPSRSESPPYVEAEFCFSDFVRAMAMKALTRKNRPDIRLKLTVCFFSAASGSQTEKRKRERRSGLYAFELMWVQGRRRKRPRQVFMVKMAQLYFRACRELWWLGRSPGCRARRNPSKGSSDHKEKILPVRLIGVEFARVFFMYVCL